MAIAFDTAANSGDQPAASSYSYSHTVTGSPPGSNRLILVGVITDTTASVSTITYNGVALSNIGSFNHSTAALRAEIWGLKSPATGSNNVAVTLSGSCNSVTGSCSYTGVDQTTAWEGYVENQGFNGVGPTNATLNVTTTADNDWVFSNVGSTDLSITCNQTQRSNISGTVGSAGTSDTNAAVTPPGVQEMRWGGIGAFQSWIINGVAIRPVQTPVSYHKKVVHSFGVPRRANY